MVTNRLPSALRLDRLAAVLNQYHRRVSLGLLIPLLAMCGCRRHGFPEYPTGYREFAYVSNTGSNTVSVLDLVNVRPDRVLQVGAEPSGITANPKRNEIYVVNSGSGTVAVINAETNQIVSTIGVHKLPYSIDVDHEGRLGYVANSGSNSVSVIDLARREQIAVVGTGEQPGVARVSPDSRSLVVSNRGSGSVSIFEIAPFVADAAPAPPRLRAVFSGCPGATDVAIPYAGKAYIACSSGHQLMVIGLADPRGAGKPDAFLASDHLVAMLDVGHTPVHLAVKPDGGEIFVSNFDSNSVSEVSTWTNEVGGTYLVGSRPTHGLVSGDNGSLWVSNFGGDAITLYSIDDGRLVGGVRAGSGPDSIALSSDEHLLLVANYGSGDIAVIRTQGRNGPELFTMLAAGKHPAAIAIKSIAAGR